MDVCTAWAGMPRCYLVKKVTSGPEGAAPRSPTEASVAPTCYSPTDSSGGSEPQTAGFKKTKIKSVIKTKHDNPKLGTEQSGTSCKIKTADKCTYTSDSETSPETIKTISYKASCEKSDASMYKIGEEIEDDPYEVAECVIGDVTEYEAADEIPYEVADIESEHNNTCIRSCNKKCNECTESVRKVNPTANAEYAELCNPCFSERSAADTEAAHELLSLAQSVPPLPPAAVVTVIAQEPPPLVPVYTYTFQPTNIYIVTEDPPEPIYAPVQTVASVPTVPTVPTVQTIPTVPTVSAVAAMPTVEYVDPQMSYVAYQPIENPQMDYIQATILDPPCAEYTIETSTEPSFPDPSIFDEEIERKRLKREAAKYDCDECGKRYATSSNLSRHKQTHRSLDSVEAKQCGECGKAYVSMPALAMHVLTHRKGHVCGLCGKQFSRPWLLRGHLRSHTGEKPYCCGVCGKAFADRSNLRAHLQTHSMDKKYECPHCHKSFALKSYLNKHQEAACIRSAEDD